MKYEIIVGWHGTLKRRMEKILEENFNTSMFTTKNGKPTLPGDLGYGTYFFIEDPILGYNPKEHTIKFLKQYKDNFKDTHCLLKVEVINKDLLDLDDQDNIEMFYTLRKKLKEQILARAEELEITGTLKRGNFDGLYIEAILTYIKEQEGYEYKLVSKRTFTDFKKFRDEIASFEIKKSNFSNGKELAVRDISLITNIEEEEIELWE